MYEPPLIYKCQTLNYNNREYTSTPQSNNNNESGDSGGSMEAPARQGLNIDHGFITEIEAYQGLMLDFETEYADFLSNCIVFEIVR